MTTIKYIDDEYINNSKLAKFSININNFLVISCHGERDLSFDLPIIQELLKLAQNKLYLNASYLVSLIPSYISVLHLDLDDYTDVTLDNLPPTLKELCLFGEYAGDFNKPLINLPLTLEILVIISITFNQSLALLPVGLRQLTLYCDKFNQSLSFLPVTLEYFEIKTFLWRIDHRDEIYNLDDKLLNLPVGIKYLHVCDCYNLDYELIQRHYPNLVEYKEII